jgi:hypothetical protein
LEEAFAEYLNPKANQAITMETARVEHAGPAVLAAMSHYWWSSK